MAEDACEFCQGAGGTVLWRDEVCRVVRVDEPQYPGFCRVILARHAREMSDLSPAERERLMDVVFAVEEAVREAMEPDKMNLASLGNMVPHVHWHVIPRFRDDAHFPTPVWGPPQRQAAVPPARAQRAERIPALLLGRLGS
ncbi:MAG TPA: HIT family protein [Usitatibacter sp.]|nr:HIT family protein [Usitatibacter sp.]